MSTGLSSGALIEECPYIPNTVPGYKVTVWAKNDLVRFLEQHPDVWERHVSLMLITGTPVRLLASETECSELGARPLPR
jgi:hypothetical protein